LTLSDDKVTHMSHVLLRELLKRDLVDITEDEGKVRHAIRRAINAQLKVGEEIDEVVRRKIESMSRGVVDGSPEWNVLYTKYFREEEVKRGMPAE